MTPRDRLARLHLINALFHRLTAHDLYLASEVLAAIEAAQDELGPGTSLGDIVRRLHCRLFGHVPDAGFAFCDGATAHSGGPLWMHAELLAALRRTARFPRTTIVLANVSGTEPAGAFTRRRGRAGRERARAESIDHLRALAAHRASPRSLVTLLFF